MEKVMMRLVLVSDRRLRDARDRRGSRLRTRGARRRRVSTFAVGFGQEPAYAGNRTACSCSCPQNGKPVTDLGDTLSVIGRLRGPVHGSVVEPFFEIGEFGTPGDYRAWFIPTRAGQYTFHFTGIDRRPEGRTRRSRPGPKTFDDVVSPTDAEFPVQDPTNGELADRIDREIPRLDSAIADAKSAAANAAASASDDAKSAKTLGLIGIVLGALGLIDGDLRRSRWRGGGEPEPRAARPRRDARRARHRAAHGGGRCRHGLDGLERAARRRPRALSRRGAMVAHGRRRGRGVVAALVIPAEFMTPPKAPAAVRPASDGVARVRRAHGGTSTCRRGHGRHDRS